MNNRDRSFRVFFTLIFITFILVISTAWEKFFIGLISYYGQIFKNENISNLIEVILITFISLIIIYFLIKYLTRNPSIKNKIILINNELLESKKKIGELFSLPRGSNK